MKPLLKVAFTLIAAVALPSAFATPDPVGAAPEKPAQAETKPLPAPADVLERYAKAIGGKEAFKKHSSQHATGTVQIPAQGINGKMEIFAARPNKLIMKSTVPGVGELNTGFNGKVGWMSTALTGPMLLQGKMLDQVATQADFDQSLHDPADYKTIQILGLEQFNGEDCYKLRLIHRTGFDSTEYFSAETGLQRGFITTQESPLGPVTTTT
ncbi:MAG TPA: hypothetical protein VGR78_13265, partial [Verrucomicrobiae bacterium]|nr:hypothetical protein [Verrucomicrobiae bacterium]